MIYIVQALSPVSKEFVNVARWSSEVVATNHANMVAEKLKTQARVVDRLDMKAKTIYTTK